LADPRLRKTSVMITSSECTLEDWPNILGITNQTEEYMLDNQEDDGRIVLEKEHANTSLF
jgi:hypothetical protein